MFKTTEDLIAYYIHHQKSLNERLKHLKKQVTWHSVMRLLCFGLEIAIFVGFVSTNITFLQYTLGVGLIVPILLFVMVVKRQARIEQRLAFQRNLLWVVENELKCLQSGENGYDHGDSFMEASHPFSSDLDIFGKHSIFALLNRSSTLTGMDLLANSLLNTSTKEEIEGRQTAVKELSKHMYSSLEFRAHMKALKLGDLEILKDKIESKLPEELIFVDKSWMKWMVSFMPACMILLALLSIFVQASIGYILLSLGIMNLMIVYSYSKKVSKVHEGFSNFSGKLSSYTQALRWTEKISWESAYILERFDASKQNTMVTEGMLELEKIMSKFDARLNMIMNVVLNAGMLWDLKCSLMLSKWNQEHARTIVEGLERLPYFESIISISTLHFNKPQWSFPTIESDFHCEAKNLAHPLITDELVVRNDFKMGQPTVDIITGSNMAGKSTFLRALGTNMVLAYTGAPVASDNMRLSIFTLLTYMRIIDALSERTSTFKAELLRLKLILQNIKQHPNSFVLIDEMLRGTNSGDKYEGSRTFILKMIDLSVPTVFATHDLQLSELSNSHPSKVRNFHFDIQISDQEMNFDYKLKAGPCNIFNAKILLKEIGLA